MIKWIIQNNLIKPKILQEFKEAFTTLTIDFEEVKVIPFSPELPKFDPAEVNIFYGSTTLMLNAYANEKFKAGVFYNPLNFNMKTYLKHWGNSMLNHDAQVMKFKQFISETVTSKAEWFIRPNEDDKSFAGTLMTSQELVDWSIKIEEIDNPLLNMDTLIVVSAPKNILKEWRNFIVNGRVIASSRYMLNGYLTISTEDCPQEMINFVEDCTAKFSPDDIFVMDIAETAEGYKIIECNCFNGTGFYNHPIERIVDSVTQYMSKSLLNV